MMTPFQIRSCTYIYIPNLFYQSFMLSMDFSLSAYNYSSYLSKKRSLFDELELVLESGDIKHAIYKIRSAVYCCMQSAFFAAHR